MKYEETLEIFNDAGERVKTIIFRTDDPEYFQSQEHMEHKELYKKIFKDGYVKGAYQ